MAAVTGWQPCRRARAVRLDLTLTDGTVVLAGPLDLPGEVFTAVNWVGQGAGYEIFPNSFYNGNPGNDFAWKTDKTDRANSSAATGVELMKKVKVLRAL